jgi:hypothetical protein
MKDNHLKLGNEQGAVLLIFLFILITVVISFLFTVLDNAGVKIEREKKTALALAEAKAALIGFVIKTNDIAVPSYLPNPDLHLSTAIPEGSESGNLGAVDVSLIGKFPWYSLDTPPLKDGWSECLWYAVSGRYKKSPHTSVFNWDTQGQIDVIDREGGLIASNLAALIIAPGSLLVNQNRTLSDSNSIQCGGNYDARNYLDSYVASNAIVGEVNYFSGSINNRLAANSLNKKFVLANNDYYNDQLLFLTVDDFFNPIMHRSDFAAHIDALLTDPYFQTVPITGSKGTANVVCASTLSTNQTFCNNWSEMFLLAQLPTSSFVTVDGVVTACTRIFIFGGKKTGLQTRVTDANKNDPENYLEGANLIAFNTASSGFEGNSTFDYTNSSADILKCL